MITPPNHRPPPLLGVPGPRDSDVAPAPYFGERSPLGVGASGRAILAAMPPEQVARVSHTGVTSGQLDAIRRRGYDMSFGENHPGVNGVSVAVIVGAAVIGSLTIAGSDSALDEVELARCAHELSTASAGD